MPEFGWLAAQVLSVEDAIDQECGVWPALQQELLSNPTVSLEIAIKVSATALHLSVLTGIHMAQGLEGICISRSTSHIFKIRGHVSNDLSGGTCD